MDCRRRWRLYAWYDRRACVASSADAAAAAPSNSANRTLRLINHVLCADDRFMHVAASGPGCECRRGGTRELVEGPASQTVPLPDGLSGVDLKAPSKDDFHCPLLSLRKLHRQPQPCACLVSSPAPEHRAGCGRVATKSSSHGTHARARKGHQRQCAALQEDAA